MSAIIMHSPLPQSPSVVVALNCLHVCVGRVCVCGEGVCLCGEGVCLCGEDVCVWGGCVSVWGGCVSVWGGVCLCGCSTANCLEISDC